MLMFGKAYKIFQMHWRSKEEPEKTWINFQLSSNQGMTLRSRYKNPVSEVTLSSKNWLVKKTTDANVWNTHVMCHVTISQSGSSLLFKTESRVEENYCCWWIERSKVLAVPLVCIHIRWVSRYLQNMLLNELELQQQHLRDILSSGTVKWFWCS